MDLAECRMLLEHAGWADALVWRAVLGLGVEDAELREKLHHLHLVQYAYLSFWRQEPVSAPDMASFPTLDSMADWARRYYRDLPSYLDTLAPEATTRDVQFPWSARLVERFGEARPATWAESVLQVAMHSSYHRGQGEGYA